jgi:pilus assembly protein CpaB
MRRRRAFVLLGLALLCGWVAATDVRGTQRRARAALGPMATALVAKQGVRAGKPLSRGQLELRSVPVRFLPPDTLVSAADAVGQPAAVALPRGSYITASELGTTGSADSATPAALGPGERALAVTASGSAAALGPAGGRVDVLVTTAAHGGPGRTYLALENVELLAVRPGADGDHVTATLRVRVRQAVYLTAAQNFAQEIRLLPRPKGDRGGTGRLSVAGSQL